MKTKLKCLVIVVLGLFCSCESELTKYYEVPDSLKGNAWQVLEKKGNFSLFLSAVERSSFKDLVQGKGLITVMAPTNEAFDAYLKEHSYGSVEAIPQEELEKLVGYHLVYYSFNKEAFENYKPEGADSESYFKGQYFKFRTKSRDAIVTMTDPTNNNARRQVIRKERFLPIYSHNLFNGYGSSIDAKSNYEYFYPSSQWLGDNGFNVANAGVVEYAIITDNGYAYAIDQVLEPLETIYNELKKDSQFDLFRNAYDRFVNYPYDEAATLDYGKGDSLFARYHTPLAPIDIEWTTGSDPSVNDFAQLSQLARRSYNVFAPNNEAMTAFFNKYWSKYYKSLDNVNFVPLLALLQNQTNSTQMLFPEQVENGLYTTDMGTIIKGDRNKFLVKKMASNGSIYGMDEVMVPNFFEKVSAPMFCDPSFNVFLEIYTGSNHSIDLLSSDATQFKVFYPSNNMVLQNTTLDGKSISYSNSNPKKYGAQKVMIEGDDGPTDMNRLYKTIISGSHIASRLLSQKGNEAIYRTLNNYNYIYTKGNRVYSSALFNIDDISRVPTMVKIPQTWSNGEAYTLVGETASALVPESNQFKNIIISNQYPSDYTQFKNLVDISGLGKATPSFGFLQGNRYIVLVPTNEAIAAGIAAGKIPTSPEKSVAGYLQSYFIKVGDSNLLDYPFSGTGVSATLVSWGSNSLNANAEFKLSDNGNNLIVEDSKGNKVKVVSYFPRIYADGAVYLIDGLLEVK